MAVEKSGFDYADCFWGNGVVANPPSYDMATAWNWEKAQTGNTHPGALMPFGWVSALPYSGAYPTGYGVVGCSSDGPGPEIFDHKTARGITHFHLSGTGFMGYFYNYLLLTPSADGTDTSQMSRLTGEAANPGYYTASLPDYGCDFELTCGKYAALHRFRFSGKNGRLSLDARQMGLDCALPKRYNEKIEFMDAKKVTPAHWHGYVSSNGVTLYFSMQIKGNVASSMLRNGEMIFDLAEDQCESLLAFSLTSVAEADERAAEAGEKGFDVIRREAEDAWAQLLGKVRVTFPGDEEKELELFYSAFYHSLIKPCDAGSEYIDFHTMWDIYRTQLPLMLDIAPEYSGKMLKSMMATIRRFGFFPSGYQMCNDYHKHDNQAAALVLYTLCDGFLRGLLTQKDYPEFREAAMLQLSNTSIEGRSPTHKLDLAGALRAVSDTAERCGDMEWAEKLRKESSLWRSAYDQATGLLIADAVYYEGTHWNYSFRPHTGMAERIGIAGGTEKFNMLLDRFFAADVKAPPSEDRSFNRDHFEGMNNESDMETPYCYLWAGRSDRLAEVNDLVRKCRFTTGDGGCPGNNDSGGLSSWYMWSVLGIYPLTGTPFYLLGSPSVETAEIDFAGGTLKIVVERESSGSIYPAEYEFNGKKINTPWLPVAEISGGGTLKFVLKNASVGQSPVPEWL